MYVILTFFGIIALRLVDVSIGALRIQYLVRGRRVLAGTLGFFESLTWVIAAALVLSDLNEWYKVVAYAGGFGLGTSLGGYLDAWIASGQVFLRVMAPVDTPSVGHALRDRGFAATVVNAEGFEGDVRMTLTAIPRRQQKQVVDIIKSVNPAAFVTVDDISANTAQLMKSSRVRK